MSLLPYLKAVSARRKLSARSQLQQILINEQISRQTLPQSQGQHRTYAVNSASSTSNFSSSRTSTPVRQDLQSPSESNQPLPGYFQLYL